MKSKEEIDKTYLQVCKDSGSKEIASEYCGFIKGYTQCQEDMAKESIAFANFLKADFEMEDSGSSDDILWLLCGTRQTYTTDEIYDEFIKSRSLINSLNRADKKYTEEDLLHAFREEVLLPNSQIGIMEDIFKQVVQSLNKQD